MRICCHSLHDSGPIQIQRTLCVSNVDTVEPLLDSIKGFDRNGIDVDGSAMKVFVHEYKIEVLESELELHVSTLTSILRIKAYLNTLKMSHFDFFQSDDGERWFS